MTWRHTSAVTDSTLVPVWVMTSGICRCLPGLDSVESPLNLISTGRYDFLSITTTTTEVPGFQCVSANNLPRS